MELRRDQGTGQSHHLAGAVSGGRALQDKKRFITPSHVHEIGSRGAIGKRGTEPLPTVATLGVGVGELYSFLGSILAQDKVL